MNIFVLALNARIAASLHCDRHVVKMILESTQMLCFAMHHLKIVLPEVNDITMYKPSKGHMYHPCTLWLLGGKNHFFWLLELALSLCKRYTDIYERTHKCEALLRHILASVHVEKLPENTDVSGWLVRLSAYNVSSKVIASCATKVSSYHCPEGCQFGIVCIDRTVDAHINVRRFQGSITYEYRKYYTFKAKKKFVMEWHRQSDPPALLEHTMSQTLQQEPRLLKQAPRLKQKRPKHQTLALRAAKGKHNASKFHMQQ